MAGVGVVVVHCETSTIEALRCSRCQTALSQQLDALSLNGTSASLPSRASSDSALSSLLSTHSCSISRQHDTNHDLRQNRPPPPSPRALRRAPQRRIPRLPPREPNPPPIDLRRRAQGRAIVILELARAEVPAKPPVKATQRCGAEFQGMEPRQLLHYNIHPDRLAGDSHAGAET